MKSLIQGLLSLLFPLSDSARIVDEISRDDIGRVILPRILNDGRVGLLPYRHKHVRAIIREAKFRNNQKALGLLAGVLTEYIEGLQEDEQAFQSSPRVLIPVPLGKERERERGHNQSEIVCQMTGLPCASNFVTRIKETVPQTSLSKQERLENVRDAFRVDGTIDPLVEYVVVDDVTTTGATMEEVMRALSRAGAHRVSGIALAY